MQLASAQENQTTIQEYVRIEGIIDELQAVHTLLALKALQDMVELQSSHAMAEGLGNQSASMANQTATNQTAANQTHGYIQLNERDR